MAQPQLVEFDIPTHRLSYPYRQLLREAFDMQDREIPSVPMYPRYNDVLTIICRDSQFGRFLILRNQKGIANSFMELKPRFVAPRQALAQRPIEVWQRH